MFDGVRSLQLPAFYKAIKFELHCPTAPRWLGYACERYANVEQ